MCVRARQIEQIIHFGRRKDGKDAKKKAIASGKVKDLPDRNQDEVDQRADRPCTRVHWRTKESPFCSSSIREQYMYLCEHTYVWEAHHVRGVRTYK